MTTWTEPSQTPPATLRVDATGVYFTEGHPLAALDDPALQARITRTFGWMTLAEALTVRTLLTHPPPSPTGDPCRCGVDRLDAHGSVDLYERHQDASAPATYLVFATRCRACGRCWTFEESGDDRYEYRHRARSFDPAGA